MLKQFRGVRQKHRQIIRDALTYSSSVFLNSQVSMSQKIVQFIVDERED